MGDPQGYWLMAAITIVVGMMGHGLVDTVWYRPQVNTLWWLAVAIVSSFYINLPIAQVAQSDPEAVQTAPQPRS
jgi:putative inorganic carbon (HCO3(-)) transporter